MNNSKLIGSVFLVGMSMILCAKTLACICPPCPPCSHLISGWPDCECEYECDPLYCETCIDGSCASWCDPAYCDQRCIAGVCAHCNGDSDKVCCDGDCVPKCIKTNTGSYNLPSPVFCRFNNIDDPSCNELNQGPGNEGGYCQTVISEGPFLNEECSCDPSCETETSYCVMTYDKVCTNTLSIFFPFHECSCEDPSGFVNYTERGTRTKCK